MKKKYLSLISFCFIANSYAQIGINATNTPPDGSAIHNNNFNQFNSTIMTKTTIRQTSSQASKWALFIFTVLSFYIFGVVLASYCITYPRFDDVHDNWQEFMSLYNHKMIIFLKIPSILWLFSSISMYFFSPKILPKWAIYASIGLALISVSATLFSVLPIFTTMRSVSFNPKTHYSLLSISMLLQIIPTGIVCLLILFFLNIYFQSIKPLSRWIFIMVTVLSFYLIGSNTVEALIEYRLWNIVSEMDWLAYRRSGPSWGLFIAVYLLPGWSTLLLIIPLIWLRPKGISIMLPICFLLFELWAAFITATYFIPKAQLPLDEAYSKQLLEDLVENDNLKRVWLMYVFGVIAGLMFFKSKNSTEIN